MSGSTIQPWVIGNWKMNPMHADAQKLISEFKQLLQNNEIAADQCHLAVAPTLLALMQIQADLADANRAVYTVAQNVSAIAGTGAYTGEVSAQLLADQQIGYVLVGHSERREIFNETAEILNQKVTHALAAGLKVIYCVGESLAQREADQAQAVVLQQICDLATVVNGDDWLNVIVAYEPIWAIGTGKTASPEDAQAMHAQIRQGLTQITAHGQRTAILYGGSVKAENAVELAACPDINGALVGGASLNAESFYQIAQAFANTQ